MILEDIKSRLNSGNVCHCLVQNLSYSHPSYKNIKIRIYETIILPVLLYGCETWSLILRGENTLRMYENRVLGRTFGLRRDDVIGGHRKLHNKELHDMYSSSSTIRIIKSRSMRWIGHVTRMG
jgi:hypothetical protein